MTTPASKLYDITYNCKRLRVAMARHNKAWNAVYAMISLDDYKREDEQQLVDALVAHEDAAQAVYEASHGLEQAIQFWRLKRRQADGFE